LGKRCFISEEQGQQFAATNIHGGIGLELAILEAQ
jgi:hypothetical protein